MTSALPDLLCRYAIAAALLLTAAPAAAQTRTDKTVLMPADPRARKAQEEYGYSNAVIAGDLIFLSGIVAGAPPGTSDLTAAFDRAYQHIGRVLNSAGASYDDIVDITTFHTDITDQIDTLAAVQKKYVRAPYPAWTAIDVDRLLPDDGLVEIKIVARKPAAAGRKR
jgi:enamine deaminase RidA (YjgF/YER057c/UK114 family)